MPHPNFPIIGVKGGARSGKDTIAGFLAEYLGGGCIAQADPMKRFAADLFGFTEDQLWGNEAKEAIDPRYTTRDSLEELSTKLFPLAGKYYTRWGMDTRVDRRAFDYALHNWFSILPVNLTPRIVLQTFGTEFGRMLDQDLWSQYALDTANRWLSGGYAYGRGVGLYASDAYVTPGWVLITDLRFRNEALNIKRAGGWIFEVINPAAVGPSNVGLAGHASETELATIPKTWTDVRIINDKSLGLEYAKRQAQLLVENLFKVSLP